MITVRAATEDDGPILSDIERRSPMRMGEVAVAIDRGDDYFATSRMMADVVIALGLVDGQPAGVNCAARHPVRVAGADLTLAYYHHLRVLPEYQGRHVSWTLAEWLRAQMAGTVDGGYLYIAPSNERSQRLLTGTPAWQVQPRWAHLPAVPLAGPPAGRPAHPADAAALAAILNTGHADEEMFRPYDDASLTARLERAPHLYGWGSVLMGDGAVVGAWPAGHHYRAVVEEGGQQHSAASLAVLDYGFEPGAEDEFVALLRASAAVAEHLRFDELSLFTSPGTASFAVLEDLGATMTPFDLFTMEVAEPPGGHPVYVDAIYF